MDPPSSGSPLSAEPGSLSSGARGGKSLKRQGSRCSRPARCFALFFVLVVLATISIYWRGSDVEPLSGVPTHLLRKWKNIGPEDVVLVNGNKFATQPSQVDSRGSKSSAFSEFKFVDFSNPTDVLNSFFEVKNAKDSLQYTLCDTLELHIEARDQHNQIKQYGGDYFWVKIYSPALDASQPADEIIDHWNGTYTARFKLRWTGTVLMQVLLIASSEFVTLLRHLRRIAPARFAYLGKFSVEGRTEITPCHITKEMYLGPQEALRSRGFCNFSDKRLGYPWFCIRPLHSPCSSWAEHMGTIQRGQEYEDLLLKGKPVSVIHNFALINQAGSTTIEVTSVDGTEEMSFCTKQHLPVCTPSLPPRPKMSAAGFYHRKFWQSLVCQLRAFNVPEALECLQGRSLYFYGDSTLRQWFEFLSIHLGHTMQEEELNTSQSCGPRRSYDRAHGISLFYRHHGYPIRNVWVKVSDIKYAANEIDDLPGGPDTVVLLSFWAHFTPTKVEFYRDRWKAVKGALGRLRKRAPGTRVIVKSANTREQKNLDMSNWYAMELDTAMREELEEEPDIAIIDVWDMTLSHSTGYRIHPLEPVISEEIQMLLNFLCPVSKQ